MNTQCAFKPSIDDKKPSIDVKKEPIHHVFCGLVWPEKGFPAYYCVIGDKIEDKTATFDISKPRIEIILEGEAKTFFDLTENLKNLPTPRCRTVYTCLDPRFHSFVSDLTRWKRTNQADLRLRNTKMSNFESGILKIRQLITEKRLIFPEHSIIRAQLAMFSKANLSDEVQFYAVRALSYVIGAFDKLPEGGTAEEIPKLKAWW